MTRKIAGSDDGREVRDAARLCGILETRWAALTRLENVQAEIAALPDPSAVFRFSAQLLNLGFNLSGIAAALPGLETWWVESRGKDPGALPETLRKAASEALAPALRSRAERWPVESTGLLEGPVEPGAPGPALVLPVRLQDRLVAVLAVARAANVPWSPGERALLGLLAHQFGLHLDNALSERRARELERMKSEFVTVVSHELRTPMTSIRSAIGLLVDGTLGSLNAEQQEYLELARRNVDRLSDLIRDVLDFSRIESGRLKLDLADADLGRLVDEAVATVTGRAPGKGAAIEVRLPTEPVVVHCDPDKIVHVLVNLIGNALVHNPAGTRVSVGAEHGSRVSVWVRDDGVGIPEKEHDRIFQRFYQVRRAAGAGSKGTGLGLTICKGLVEAHGGGIRVESTPGKGATFSFDLEAGPARPGIGP